MNLALGKPAEPADLLLEFEVQLLRDAPTASDSHKTELFWLVRTG